MRTGARALFVPGGGVYWCLAARATRAEGLQGWCHFMARVHEGLSGVLRVRSRGRVLVEACAGGAGGKRCLNGVCYKGKGDKADITPNSECLKNRFTNPADRTQATASNPHTPSTRSSPHQAEQAAPRLSRTLHAHTDAVKHQHPNIHTQTHRGTRTPPRLPIVQSHMHTHRDIHSAALKAARREAAQLGHLTSRGPSPRPAAVPHRSATQQAYRLAARSLYQTTPGPCQLRPRQCIHHPPRVLG